MSLTHFSATGATGTTGGTGGAGGTGTTGGTGVLSLSTECNCHTRAYFVRVLPGLHRML